MKQSKGRAQGRQSESHSGLSCVTGVCVWVRVSVCGSGRSVGAAVLLLEAFGVVGLHDGVVAALDADGEAGIPPVVAEAFAVGLRMLLDSIQEGGGAFASEAIHVKDDGRGRRDVGVDGVVVLVLVDAGRTIPACPLW